MTVRTARRVRAAAKGVTMSSTRFHFPTIMQATNVSIAVPIGVALLLSLLAACNGSSDGGTINPGHKTVFLSSAEFNGNLGGLSGADAKCQSMADAAHLAGTYRAWLSGSTVTAESRLTQWNRPYQLVNGTKVADNFADLADGSIDHPINIDENGATYGNPEVWTGGAPYHCADWSSDSSDATGVVGLASSTDHTWFEVYLQYCSRTNVRLYCIEQ